MYYASELFMIHKYRPKEHKNSFASGIFLQVQTLKVKHNFNLFKSMFAKLAMVLEG